MALLSVDHEDLLFDEDIGYSINTILTLDDDDWMDYKLNTRFRTKSQGDLLVEFRFLGLVCSDMKVEQNVDGTANFYKYTYSSDLFEKYIKWFMYDHIAAWNSEYAFDGEPIVMDFFNEVLENGKLERTDMGG